MYELFMVDTMKISSLGFVIPGMSVEYGITVGWRASARAAASSARD